MNAAKAEGGAGQPVVSLARWCCHLHLCVTLPLAPLLPAAASDSPTFSFGFGALPAGAAAGAPDACEQAAGEAGTTDAAAAEAAAAPDAAGAPILPRISSGETVQQPNPFEAMLHHLRGPQYASPARFALRGPAALQLEQAGSPQSPKDCTPLHLISVSECNASPAARERLWGRRWLGLRGSCAVLAAVSHAVQPCRPSLQTATGLPVAAGTAGMATPAPGQGSLTVWMDRRGMRGALSTPARNDLRVLWAAAHEVARCKSGECWHGGSAGSVARSVCAGDKFIDGMVCLPAKWPPISPPR